MSNVNKLINWKLLKENVNKQLDDAPTKADVAETHQLLLQAVNRIMKEFVQSSTSKERMEYEEDALMRMIGSLYRCADYVCEFYETVKTRIDPDIKADYDEINAKYQAVSAELRDFYLTTEALRMREADLMHEKTKFEQARHRVDELKEIDANIEIMLSNTQQEISALSKKIETQQQAVLSAETEKETKTSESNKLQDCMQSIGSELQKAKEYEIQLTAEIAKAQSALDAQKNIVATLKADKDRLSLMFENEKNLERDMHATIKEYETQCANIQSSYINIKHSYEIYSQHLAENKAILQTIADVDISDIQTHLSKIERQLAETDEAITKCLIKYVKN